MKKLGKHLRVLLVLAGTALFVMMLVFSTNANMKYQKDTTKKCTDCHKQIPKKGDKDVHLTDLGQKFKDNGYKLPK
jgi:hypothetical protein